MRAKQLSIAIGVMFLALSMVLPAGIQRCAQASGSQQTQAMLDSCIVELTGDVNVSGTITSADVIVVVKYVFLMGGDPQPCIGAANVNGNETVNSSDIIYLINYVFKNGPAPIDVCACPCALFFGCIQ